MRAKKKKEIPSSSDHSKNSQMFPKRNCYSAAMIIDILRFYEDMKRSTFSMQSNLLTLCNFTEIYELGTNRKIIPSSTIGGDFQTLCKYDTMNYFVLHVTPSSLRNLV